jgi:hypothetical protein
MNAVFTIVAKNYLPLAFAQAETLKKYHSDIDYSILLADSPEGLDLDAIPYTIKLLDVLEIDNILELEFKYNLTEFCTAVKPYYINYLFKLGFNKVIYLDPDVCVFSSLQPIFDELNNKSIVVTPHFITPEINYTGTITEALLLHVGVFNFGFVAVSDSERGLHFIGWWQNRLHDMCYQDKIEALHTDQKWIDLVPAFYGDEVLISNDIGRNMAFWNLHERKLVSTGDGYYEVENRFTGEKTPLLLFHFAGYDIAKAESVIHKHHPEYIMDDFPELRNLFIWYRDALLANGFNKYISLPYKFNTFENGSFISIFQRRLYRRLIEDGDFFHNPFSAASDSFYSILKNNGLVSSTNTDKFKNKDVEQFKSKIAQLNFILKRVKYILGFDRYSLLLKFCMRYFRPENQTFLIKERENGYEFRNENQKLRNASKNQNL